MKKHTAIALVSALAIAAGTFSVVNMQPAVKDSQETAGSAVLSYEEAIADLYARSTTISDQEILEIARKMKPDCTAVADKLGQAEADKIIETLSGYEQRKASYLLENKAQDADQALIAEWDRQDAYTDMGISPEQTLTRLIPGYTVTSCEEKDGQLFVDVDEWMTEGYTEGDEDTENVSAYRYYYTAVLKENSEGKWEVVAVTNTDVNFAWLQDAGEQVQMSGLESTEGNASEGGADSASADGVKTASLKTYGDGIRLPVPVRGRHAQEWQLVSGFLRMDQLLRRDHQFQELRHIHERQRR